ncbi:uncharacterized protein F4812DRAFT_418731 [Daldinia caldariorum]|uniref:uncharacterized protein n=1 Tax=Daldinia caldariorum TaxID=326644 RepID=UPI002007AA72|nr:uncharacterized protein F4812DRAFT_418731 [Daldinia caldariorum]KAI1470710.1 hypothetical protein F4812DRAFT_418731 [Daldinia caldariorum]
MRIANRSLAVHRALNSKNLLAKNFWDLSRPKATTNTQEESISPDSSLGPRASKYQNLLSFIDGDDFLKEQQDSSLRHQELARTLSNSPIFTAAVDKFVHSELSQSEHNSDLVPQYGLIGTRRDNKIAASLEDGLVIGNVNVPWSAFICGSQGAGKSHTLCCLLENSLIASNNAGALPYPLAGMVMHYDDHANYSTAQVCEAAYLCSSGIPVTILVSPSNIWAMKRLYTNLPGLPPGSPKPKVVPLYFDEHQLDASRILKLMAVDPTADKTPLYMEVVMDIVRTIAMEGSAFTYSKFRERIASVKWMSGQETSLNLRLQLLDNFMAPSPMTKSTRPAKSPENIWAFEPGSLTIVDMSDPFMSSDEACTLFSICLSIFLEERNKCGRVVAMDEAHKFLAQSGEARVLTNELVSVIRQQRHTGTRVVIATQEPTLSPTLIDLVNATFVHRFLSPNWYEVLKRHLAGANTQDPGHNNSLFRTIVGLRTGQALLFCPTARMDVDDEASDDTKGIRPLNDSYVKIQIRKRLTADGGKSITATSASETPEASVDIEVPMHIVEPKVKGGKKGGKNKGKSQKESSTPATFDAVLDAVADQNPNSADESVASDNQAKEGEGEEKEGEGEEEEGERRKPPQRSRHVTKEEMVQEGVRHFSLMAQEHNNWERLASIQRRYKSQFWDELEENLGLRPGMISCNVEKKSYLVMAIDKELKKISKAKKHQKK